MPKPEFQPFGITKAIDRATPILQTQISPPDKPSLGSVGDVHFNQERWAAGGRRDLEKDDGESGIADQDGLDEQVPFRDWQGVGMV
jgi:hypothetical protein